MTKVATFGGDDDEPDDLAKMAEQYGGAKEIEAVDRLSDKTLRSSLALWLAGATFAEIASQLELRSPGVVRIAIERALSETVDDTEDRTKLRTKMSLTLDRLLRSVMTKALSAESPEHLAAVRAAMVIVDRKIRLHGLDAPAEHIVYTPGQDEFTRIIELAARGQGLSLPEEGDPFADEIEGEVVDDDDDQRGAA